MISRLFVLTLLLQPTSLWAQQRPLITEPASTTEKGTLRLELGFEFYQKAVFELSGLEGDLTRLGMLGVRFGVADNVEIQVGGSIQDFLNIDERWDAPNSPILDFSGNSTSDVGDFTLAAKIRINKEGQKLPSFGFRFGVELPNASNESGLGNDTTNAFGEVLAEKTFERLTLLGNLGIAILGDPLQAASQDDLLTYGGGAKFAAHPRINIVGEIYGRAGPGGIGTEEQTRVRAGLQIVTGKTYWDVAGFWGFQDTDPSSGILVGLSHGFDLF
jgi:hypothetical protein